MSRMSMPAVVYTLLLTAREAQANNNANWFAWEKAAEEVQKVRKDIWIAESINERKTTETKCFAPSSPSSSSSSS
eukprot:10503618-Karenia_brevis.AAC.1